MAKFLLSLTRSWWAFPLNVSTLTNRRLRYKGAFLVQQALLFASLASPLFSPRWQGLGLVLLSVLLSVTGDLVRHSDHQQELDCELVPRPILILKTEEELSGKF